MTHTDSQRARSNSMRLCDSPAEQHHVKVKIALTQRKEESLLVAGTLQQAWELENSQASFEEKFDGKASCDHRCDTSVICEVNWSILFDDGDIHLHLLRPTNHLGLTGRGSSRSM